MYLVQGLRSQPRQLHNPPATALGGPDKVPRTQGSAASRWRRGMRMLW